MQSVIPFARVPLQTLILWVLATFSGTFSVAQSPMDCLPEDFNQDQILKRYKDKQTAPLLWGQFHAQQNPEKNPEVRFVLLGTEEEHGKEIAFVYRNINLPSDAWNYEFRRTTKGKYEEWNYKKSAKDFWIADLVNNDSIYNFINEWYFLMPNKKDGFYTLSRWAVCPENWEKFTGELPDKYFSEGEFKPESSDSD